jgi:hypothetical protein
VTRSITEQARDAYASDSCQCGAFKIGRRYWFCWKCDRRLPEKIQKDLHYMNKNWQVSYVEALKILNRAESAEDSPDTQVRKDNPDE